MKWHLIRPHGFPPVGNPPEIYYLYLSFPGTKLAYIAENFRIESTDFTADDNSLIPSIVQRRILN